MAKKATVKKAVVKKALVKKYLMLSLGTIACYDFRLLEVKTDGLTFSNNGAKLTWAQYDAIVGAVADARMLVKDL